MNLPRGSIVADSDSAGHVLQSVVRSGYTWVTWTFTGNAFGLMTVACAHHVPSLPSSARAHIGMMYVSAWTANGSNPKTISAIRRNACSLTLTPGRQRRDDGHMALSERTLPTNERYTMPAGTNVFVTYVNTNGPVRMRLVTFSARKRRVRAVQIRSHTGCTFERAKERAPCTKSCGKSNRVQSVIRRREKLERPLNARRLEIRSHTATDSGCKGPSERTRRDTRQARKLVYVRRCPGAEAFVQVALCGGEISIRSDTFSHHSVTV